VNYHDLELQIDVDSGVAIITLNRPAVHNALNERIRLELTEAVEHCATDEAVGAIILTGAGPKAFCVGADLKSAETNHSTTDFAKYLSDQARTGGWYRTLNRFPKPVVGAINGYAAGSGLQLALTADILLGSTAASFWIPQVSLGLAPHVGTLVRLARIIGQQRAMRMALTGQRLSAEQAHDWGLLSGLTSPNDLMPQAVSLAEELARQPALAIRMAKESYLQAIDMTWDQAMAYDQIKSFSMWQTADRAERHAAFAGSGANANTR
jgi:enoyl-CoA hydratase